MSFFEIFVIAIGLSMDAFAVAVCKGIKMRPFNIKRALVIGLAFGGAQALMPLIGWFLGKQFESYIVAIDHWIAFGLLAFIGGKMAIESFKKDSEDECGCGCDKFDIGELIVMAIATSIDALAVGITFAFLQVSVGLAVGVIGVTTLILCFAGAFIGCKFGSALKSKAEFAGGVILVLMGLKILLEHLGYISF